MNILLTGASGFIGKALINGLLDQGDAVVAAVRKSVPGLSAKVSTVKINTLFELQDPIAMQGIEVVIHCAARVHVMTENATDPIGEYRKVNTTGTLNLAKQAANAGVKRFVFLSSIGVLDKTNNHALSESDTPNPLGAYEISKYEAEQGLLDLAKETGLEVVIIRPPLVYGPKAPGNFGVLQRWINKGIPLPLGLVKNQRSFVALDNLVSFIALCANYRLSPQAANEVFLISDGEDVSTPDLIKKLGKALGKKILLLPVPVNFMKFITRLVGKGDLAVRLFGSLTIDSSKARNTLGWRPVISMDEQLKKIADTY